VNIKHDKACLLSRGFMSHIMRTAGFISVVDRVKSKT